MGKGIDFGAYKSKFEELASDVARLGASAERPGTAGFEWAENPGFCEHEQSVHLGAGGALAVFAAAVALVVIGTLILLTIWLT